jgi:WS/DGAT/MGAT family acyltransferase
MGQRSTGLDAQFAYGEASGWPLHMVSMGLFDAARSAHGLDVERVRELFRCRLPHIGGFRRRLQRVPGGVDRPVWVDTDVDVRDHVHAAHVPPPGTPRQLAEVVGEIASVPLDFDRPLWEKWVVDGIEGGLVAVVDKLHHAVTDGIRGMEIQAASYDIAPDAPFVRPGGTVEAPEHAPPPHEVARHAATSIATLPLRALSTMSSVARAGVRVAGAVRRGEASGYAAPLTAPRTSLNARVTKRRAVAYCSLPLPDLHALAKQEGATVNDLVLALAGRSLHDHLVARGERPARPLTAVIPVGLPNRDGGAPTGGNQIAMTTASLATDVDDPVEQLRAVARSTRAGKAMLRAIGPELLMDLLDVAPPAVLGATARGYGRLGLSRVHPPVASTLVSNVRGAPVPLYLAGARLVATHPFGPVIDGLAVNITVLGYLDSLDFGVHTCPDVVEDPWEIVDGIRDAAAALRAHTRVAPVAREA